MAARHVYVVRHGGRPPSGCHNTIWVGESLEVSFGIGNDVLVIAATAIALAVLILVKRLAVTINSSDSLPCPPKGTPRP